MTILLSAPLAAGVLSLALGTNEPIHGPALDEHAQFSQANDRSRRAAASTAASPELRSLGEAQRLIRTGDRRPVAGGGIEAGDIARVLGALGLVVGLIVLTRAVLRRAGGGLGAASRPSGVLEILARYPVGRGQQLILLKLGRRIVLVHGAGGSMRTLSEISDNNEVAAILGRIEAGSTGRDSHRFRRLLERFEREHEESPAVERGEIVDLTRQTHEDPRSFSTWLGLGRSTP